MSGRATIGEGRRAASLRRYLGVLPGAEPRVVLALEGGELTVGRVEAAARRRWQQIAEHPASGEPEAHFAKQAVLTAAEALLGRPPGGVEDRATPQARLDRAIVEVLRASRGLNHEASLRLAGLARRTGLAPEAILARVRRLVDRREASGSPRRFDRIPTRRRIATRGSEASEFSRLLAEVETVVEAGRDDGERSAPVRALVLVTIVLAVVAGAVVSSWPRGEAEPPQASKQDPRPSTIAAPEPATIPTTRPDNAERSIEADLLPTVPFAVRSATPFRGAAAERVTALRAGILDRSAPIDPAAAADLAGRLRDLADRIRGARGQLDAAMRSNWSQLQAEAGRVWPVLSGSRRRDLVAATGECFDSVETPSAALDLIDGLGMLEPSRSMDGAAVRRGAWGAAVLAEVARRATLATTVRDRVSERFDRLNLPARSSWAAPSAFEETAARWLAAASRELAVGGIDTATLAAWSSWFAATDGLDPVSLRERADLEALRMNVRSWREGDEQGDRPLVIAALLARLDPAELPDPAIVREMLAPHFAAEGGIADASAAAWIVSSLLAEQPAFGLLPIVPFDASDSERTAWLEAIEQAWPTPRPRRLRADPELISRSGDLLAAIRQRPRRGEQALLEGLVAAGRIHEATMLARFDRRRSRELLDGVEASLRRSEANVDPPAASGTASGLDGEFADAFAKALNDREARIALVRALRGGGGDLGPQDAKAFARAILKDAREVRHAAAAVLLESLAHGPNVLVALLDLSPGLENDELLGRTVSRLSGRELPEEGDPDRPRAIRAALVERALAAMPSEARRLEAIAATYANTLLARAAAERAIGAIERGELEPAGFSDRLQAESSPSAAAPTSDPIVAAKRYREGVRWAAIPDAGAEDAARLDRRLDLRRSIASGPSHRLVAELSGLAEWQALAARAARPGDAAIASLLAAAENRRGGAASSLEQAIELEFLLVELALRLAAEEEPAS
ncbi:MAG: hypothetical protein ACO4BU_05225 [Phycisphaerales bacterium]